MYRNGTQAITVGVFSLIATGIFIGQAFTPGKGGPGLTVLAAITAAAAGASLA
jgi:hypothetical protein